MEVAETEWGISFERVQEIQGAPTLFQSDIWPCPQSLHTRNAHLWFPASGRHHILAYLHRNAPYALGNVDMLARRACALEMNSEQNWIVDAPTWQ